MFECPFKCKKEGLGGWKGFLGHLPPAKGQENKDLKAGPLSHFPLDAYITLTEIIFVSMLYEDRETLILNLLKILYNRCF